MRRTALWFAAAMLAACQPPSSPDRSRPVITTPAPAEAHRLDVLGSFLSYREVGSGSPIVLLHGNPTSSFVWRDVMPILAPHGRCLAPDLIGMGASGKPEIGYRFHDHARYLDAWIEALDLRSVVVVGLDWGGVLGLDWARRHADRVRGVVVFETFLKPMRWSDFPPQGAELFRALRTPGVGESLVLEQNGFLERSLGHGVKRGLTPTERAAYEAPFPTPSSRRPMLQWPREIPIDGEPRDVAAIVDDNARWMGGSPRIPKLLLTFEGGGLSNAPPVVTWAKGLEGVEVVPLGPAGHHAPEDAPEAIGKAIAAWLARHPTTLR